MGEGKKVEFKEDGQWMGFHELSHFLKEANLPGFSQCCAGK
jgi:hypothetical protein